MDLDRVEDLKDTGPDWSVSRLHTIMECGKKYSFKYVDHVEEPVTPPLAFGSGIHSTIHKLHLSKEWHDSFVQRLWSDEWYVAQKDVDWDHTNYRRRTYDDKGPKILEAYVAKHKEDQWIALEEHFRFDPGHGLPVLRGTFDKVQRLTEHPDVPPEYVGRLAIIDYKTSKNSPDPLLLSVDPQLTIYHRAAKEVYNEDVILGLHWLPGEIIEHKKDTKSVSPIYWTTRGNYDMNEVAIMLVEGKSRVDNKKYERNLGWACRYCSFKEICLSGINKE